ncbi:MAG: hypothetical protein HZA54_17630, partial [Planctomycetes bacterium]|nr:hypothetical protein [Planctomycetota bacterium]
GRSGRAAAATAGSAALLLRLRAREALLRRAAWRALARFERVLAGW